MKGTGGEENRREPRVCLSSDVECDVDTGRVRWRFADLSAGGMFIDVYDPLPPGTRFGVRFQLDPPPISARAQVHYVQPRIGMGVEFVWLLDPYEREALVYTPDEAGGAPADTLETGNPSLSIALDELWAVLDV